MKTCDIDILHKYFEYRDGQLFWKIRRSQMMPGMRAGTPIKPNGKVYWQIYVNGAPFREHRIIFAMFHGYWPKYIDHIDGDSLNNRIDNLRECTVTENNQNRFDVRGVCYLKHCKRYHAYINVDKKRINLGYYKTKSEALNARKRGEEKYFN